MTAETLGRFGVPVVLAAVDSTNDYVRRFIPQRRPRVVLAAAQTAGRGRFGRFWHSPAGAGLYVSYLVFPEWDASRSPLLNVVASLAVVRTLRRLSSRLDLRIKEPNDVLVGGRKIAGILVELATLGTRIDWAVVGIGVNVGQTAFPEDLPSATSLALEGVSAQPGELLGPLSEEVEAGLVRCEAGDFEALNQAYLREQR
jgi:BirA family biotin operon repressor/biotin-[acetyl-CoA-carboxylase] ligase